MPFFTFIGGTFSQYYQEYMYKTLKSEKSEKPKKTQQKPKLKTREILKIPQA